jgi:hypothetical protein
MFSPNFYIDQFQHTKKIVGDQMFKDQPELKQVADNWIDAQTKFANMIVDNSITMIKYYVDQSTAFSKTLTK